jgi:hypothetical protein
MNSVSDREVSQRFIQFIMMQAQNIMYLLGRVAGPDGGSPPPNLKAAKLLIDQLEMIEVKTKGNLTQKESSMLANILTEVRLIFVETSGGVSPEMIPTPSYSNEEDDLYETSMNEVARPQPSAAKSSAQQAVSTTSSKEKPQTKSDPADIPTKRKFFKSYG